MGGFAIIANSLEFGLFNGHSYTNIFLQLILWDYVLFLVFASYYGLQFNFRPYYS